MELPAAFGAARQPGEGVRRLQVDGDDLALFMRLSHTPKPAKALDSRCRW